MEVTHMGSDSLFGIPILEVTSEQSTTPASPQAIVQTDHPLPHHNSKWTKDHPLNNIIEALTQSCWIEAMQEELHEFERLELWELVPRPDQVMVITLKGIFINQSKYALESLKKYGFKSCDPVDTPMVEKSKPNEDKEGKAVDPSHYR
nr:integrase, catalytic region, zinc finger, CCHC-type, peptidase aspartic, catalytic [Tanacetum cinerariifolium]